MECAASAADASESAAALAILYAEVGVRDGLHAAQWANKPKPTLFDTPFVPAVHASAAPRPPSSASSATHDHHHHRRRSDTAPSTVSPRDVAAFVFPHGVRLVTPDVADVNSIPVVTSFVLTDADKRRMYGACIVWYEPLPRNILEAYLAEDAGGLDAASGAAGAAAAEDATPAQGAVAAAASPSAHAPEAICLLSSLPIFEALNSCCRQLFRLRLTGVEITEELLAPLFSTPLPQLGGSVFLQLGNLPLSVCLPRESELPHTMMSGRDFLLLFERLDVASVIMLWAMLLTEHKVLLQATQCHVLTMAAETLSALLFPFGWQWVYIPILPASLLDILQAPVPFLIGLDGDVLSLAVERGEVPDDVVQVDLDEGTISCDPAAADAMRLPQKAYHKLYKAIAPYCRSADADAATATNAMTAFPMAPPPDVNPGEGSGSLADMSDEDVAAAVGAIKAAFLRFFVSLMMRYQELMVIPPPSVGQPSALDFFDLRRWLSRHGGGCAEWLETFARAQAFNQWLEQRLAPSSSPSLDVVFFNEQIDAKANRAAKGKLFNKIATPLLTTGKMATSGYLGELVPEQVRTVYNASLITARPLQSQQQVALLLFLGADADAAGVAGDGEKAASAVNAEYVSRLKQEFARLLLWSKVDVSAALRVHVCEWSSSAALVHAPFSGFPLDSAPVREGALELALYATSSERRAQLHAALARALTALAADGGEDMPLCVIACGFGGVVVQDVIAALQHATTAGGGERERDSGKAPRRHSDGDDDGGASDVGSLDLSSLDLSPLERGETLAFLGTLGCPSPLLPKLEDDADSGSGVPAVPAQYILRRWPRLRGGWTNLFHRADPLACPLQDSRRMAGARVTDVATSARPQKGQPVQWCYTNDVEDFVRPVAQAISWVWQDVNRESESSR